jgi:REP element-mobilizing transposase RayT
MPRSFVSLHFHLVFSTKERAPLITPDLEQRLYQYIGGIVRGQGGRLISAGGIPDHVHLLTSMSKQRCISDTLRDIKSNSSRWVHEKFPQKRDFAWQEGYGAFSIGRTEIETVKAYIHRQRQHHGVITFQDEFIKFLKEYDIEYDERFIWD